MILPLYVELQQFISITVKEMESSKIQLDKKKLSYYNYIPQE